MLKLLFLLLLVNCVFSNEAETTSEKCKEMFEPHGANIVDCCDSPLPQHETGYQCYVKCKFINEDDNCSCRNCLKENNFVPREKAQFLKLFDQNLNREFTADEKRNWSSVLSNSFEHCKPLMDIENGTDECQFPKFYQQMTTCMRQQNFVDCPRSFFAPSEKCEATRKFLKEQDNCGTQYGDTFVIDDSIFDQHSNRMNTCKKTFKEAKLEPWRCVNFPYIALPNDDHYVCLQKCLSNVCCLTPCLLNATSPEDFYKDFVQLKIVEFIKSDCINFRIDYDIWKPVIESSFGICYDLASKVIGTKKCIFRMKFLSLVDCMQQELFLNAPTSLIYGSGRFENIKKLIANETKCGHKLGEKLIIDGSFWRY